MNLELKVYRASHTHKKLFQLKDGFQIFLTHSIIKIFFQFGSPLVLIDCNLNFVRLVPGVALLDFHSVTNFSFYR